MAKPYDMQKQPDGLWSIIDVFTGLPVVMDDIILINIDIEEADDILDLINGLDIEKRRARGIP